MPEPLPDRVARASDRSAASAGRAAWPSPRRSHLSRPLRRLTAFLRQRPMPPPDISLALQSSSPALLPAVLPDQQNGIIGRLSTRRPSPDAYSPTSGHAHSSPSLILRPAPDRWAIRLRRSSPLHQEISDRTGESRCPPLSPVGMTPLRRHEIERPPARLRAPPHRPGGGGPHCDDVPAVGAGCGYPRRDPRGGTPSLPKKFERVPGGGGCLANGGRRTVPTMPRQAPSCCPGRPF